MIYSTVEILTSNYQYLIFLRNIHQRKTNKLIRSSTSNSSSNTLKQSPRLFDLMKQCNDVQRSICRAQRTLISKQAFMVRLIPMRSIKVVREKSQSHVVRKVL